MFERYTEKARRTIFFARYEASHFGSPYVESEHVLLGLLRESKALSARLFANSPVTADTIRKQIEKHTTFGETIPTSVDLPINEECQRILLHASEEAERLGHKYVGTEHLLLGVLLEKHCYAAHLLNESGVSLEVARAYIGGGTLEEVATPPKSPGIPMGSSWEQLLYNPASESIVAEMRSVADRPLPPLGRLFMRPRQADAYEQIGNPADDVSCQTPVTCEKQPIVVFNSIKWDKVKGEEIPMACTSSISEPKTCQFALGKTS
jgi:ATP-dependent Clp protease ATP-binding subunit ClpC